MPQSGQRMLELVAQGAEALAVLGQVDRVVRRAHDREPASASTGASLSGVWPPNWIAIPSGCSRSQTASTSSAPSGSK